MMLITVLSKLKVLIEINNVSIAKNLRDPQKLELEHKDASDHVHIVRLIQGTCGTSIESNSISFVSVMPGSDKLPKTDESLLKYSQGMSTCV